MALGHGKTEHSGARDMTRKHAHWGYTAEPTEWATRARRRDEVDELREELEGALRDAEDEQRPRNEALADD